MDETFDVVVELDEGYAFKASFPGRDYGELALDEPAPLGADRAPNAARVLASAVGGCLAASLLLCLRKSRAEPSSVTARVTARLARNEQARWRIASLDVALAAEDVDAVKLSRCAALFEEYCIVTQSVRQGIPVNVRLAGTVG